MAKPTNKKLSACPLFDTIEYLQTPFEHIATFFRASPPAKASVEFEACKQFLTNYVGSQDTYNAYRRELERLCQWSWFIAKRPIFDFHRDDIHTYMAFIASPPKELIGKKQVQRFIQDEMGERVPNPVWRPFVVRSKALSAKHTLSNASRQAILSILSTFYTYLYQEEYISANPIRLIRQKKRYIQKEQNKKVTRKLSSTQWEYVIDSATLMSKANDKYQRTLFIMSAFYLLGLRISELAETPGRIPKMSDFAPDAKGLWWFSTVGKGNKARDVAVPDEMLAVLKAYRKSLTLPLLPTRGEQTPLVPKQRGSGGLKVRQIRALVQECFDHAIYRLKEAGQENDALDLEQATVHWLRHTAISADINHRPREHVRDDVGHENPATTERYIDIDRSERHASAKGKSLKPTS